MRRLGPLLALVFLMLVSAAPASAATGDLTFKDCLAKFVSGPCTAVPNEVLEGARDVAISPNGKFVYVPDFQDSVVGFKRSLNTGSLTYAGCIDSGDDVGCTHLSTNVLQSPRDLAFSPDGASLYVVTETSDTLLRLNVGADGALTLAGCVEDDSLPDFGCPDATGLENPLNVAVSPDGTSVYVSSIEAAVSHFSASLVLQGCYREVAITGCETQAEPLESPYGLTVSPDGKHLYATSVGRDAITWFKRAESGALTLGGCLSDDDDATAFSDACAEEAGVNYDWPNHIAFNPTGAHAYVTDETGLGVVYHFTRDATSGALTRQDCLADDLNVDAPGCAELDDATGSGLGSVTDAVVSPDSAHLYTAARQDSALSTFGLASPSGAMTHIRCLRANEVTVQGCAPFGSATLDAPYGVAISSDGHDLYVANGGGVPALLHFEREAPGTRPGEEGGEEPGPDPEPGPGPAPGPSPGPGPGGDPKADPPTAKCNGLKATIVGSGRADSLKGTAKRDVIAAGAGADKVQSLGGKDVVCGEGGPDQLGGGPDSDTLIGGPGRDVLKGAGGADNLQGGPGADKLLGGPGADKAKQ